jgi:hypothetical protein
MGHKHAIARLSRPLESIIATKNAGALKDYLREELLQFVRELWLAMEQIGAKRMKVALEVWLTFYENEQFTERHRLALSDLSPPTLNSEPMKTVRPEASAPKRRRFISAFVRREVWNHARGQCEANFRADGPERFRRCSARRLLQIEYPTHLTGRRKHAHEFATPVRTPQSVHDSAEDLSLD